MKFHRIIFFAIIFDLMSAAPPASAVLLEGNTISKQRYFPHLDSQIDETTYHLVSLGKEIDGTQDLSSGGISYDFSDTKIRLSWEYHAQFHDFPDITYSTAEFNGAAFADVFRKIDDFKSINFVTNIKGFTADRISFNANEIYINWQGLTIRGTDFISVGLNELPEPSSLALFGFAAVGLGVTRRRQRSFKLGCPR